MRKSQHGGTIEALERKRRGKPAIACSRLDIADEDFEYADIAVHIIEYLNATVPSLN
jgi:hypothetical protein